MKEKVLRKVKAQAKFNSGHFEGICLDQGDCNKELSKCEIRGPEYLLLHLDFFLDSCVDVLSLYLLLIAKSGVDSFEGIFLNTRIR